jgi:SHS2 domain-containing protein
MFETFEHKADIGVRGFGKSREEAFSECAKAMFSVIAELKEISGKESQNLEIKAQGQEGLLVGFLNELLFLHDSKQMLFSSFDLYITGPPGSLKLEGKVFGEKINKARHGIKGDVKAATYHQAKVLQDRGKWVAQCVVDV